MWSILNEVYTYKSLCIIYYFVYYSIVYYLLYILSISYISLLFYGCIWFKGISTLREKFLTLFLSQFLSPQPSVCALSPHKAHTHTSTQYANPLFTSFDRDFIPPPRGWSGVAAWGTPHPPTTHNPKKTKSTPSNFRNKTKKVFRLTRYRHTQFRPFNRHTSKPQTHSRR